MRQRSNFWGVGNSFTVFNALQSTWMVKKKKTSVVKKKNQKENKNSKKQNKKKLVLCCGKEPCIMEVRSLSKKACSQHELQKSFTLGLNMKPKSKKRKVVV